MDFSGDSYLDVLMRVYAKKGEQFEIAQVKKRFHVFDEKTGMQKALVTVEFADGTRAIRKPCDCALVIPFEQEDYVICAIDPKRLYPIVGETVLAWSYKKQIYVKCEVVALDGEKARIAADGWNVEIDVSALYVDLSLSLGTEN